MPAATMSKRPAFRPGISEPNSVITASTSSMPISPRTCLAISGASPVIPIPLRSDRCGPIEGAEGADAAGLGEERVPGRAAGIEDVDVGRPQAVREEALAEVEPHPLDRVELGGVGRQEDGRQVRRDGEVAG